MLSFLIQILTSCKGMYSCETFLGSIISGLNPFPNKPWLLRVCSTSLLKTLWEKENCSSLAISPFPTMLSNLFGELSSIFIQLNIIVCKLFHFGRVKNLLFGKGLKKKNLVRHFLQDAVQAIPS